MKFALVNTKKIQRLTITFNGLEILTFWDIIKLLYKLSTKAGYKRETTPEMDDMIYQLHIKATAGQKAEANIQNASCNLTAIHDDD